MGDNNTKWYLMRLLTSQHFEFYFENYLQEREREREILLDLKMSITLKIFIDTSHNFDSLIINRLRCIDYIVFYYRFNNSGNKYIITNIINLR